MTARMKRLLPAILVVLLLVAALMLIHAWRKLSELEGEVAQLRAEHPKPLPKQSSRKAVAAADTPGTTTGVAQQPAEPAQEKDHKNAANDMLMGAGAKEIASRSAARLTLLRDRLKLRPEQMAELEKAAAARSAALLAAFERIRNNKARPPDMGLFMDWSLGRFDLPVKPLLDAEQVEQFAGLEAAQRTSRIEGLVNIEMLELQGQPALHLTPEQKDQVFAALSGVNAAEDALGEAYYADDGRFADRIDDSLNRRREALQSVLDAAQWQSYGAVLDEDRALIMRMFGGDKAAK